MTKVPKFRTQNGLFGYFWANILRKTTVIFKISILKFSYLQNFAKKKKMPKFGTKNAFFGYFWARILKKLLSYLKSASSHLSICKIPRKKQKCLNLGPKVPDLCIFELEFKNIIVIFEIITSNLSNCKTSRKNQNA